MMKKALVLVLLAAFVVPAFADDALTLPTGVWRTRIIPTYLFADSTFGDDFEFDRTSIDDVSIFALGLAVEYGINDWITAAVQWAPAMALWSDVDVDGDADVSVNTWFDVFAGAKFQVLGENAPVRNDRVRLAFAPGVKIPLPSADWEDEAENAGDGDDFIGANVDRNVLGVGGRFYFDYVFSNSFFVNLYSEFIGYPIDGNAASLTQYGAVATHNGIVTNENLVNLADAGFLTSDMDRIKDDAFGFGYDLTLEFEATYIHQASPGLRITPSLPVTFTYSPEPTLDGTKLSDVEGYYLDENGNPVGTYALIPGGGGAVGPTELDKRSLFPNAGDSMSLVVTPKVEFFFTGLPVPTALQVEYRYPLMGKNTNATNAVVIQVKNYLKFW